ncbi:flagellar filament capping protein FliD [Gammaproteobacteria bacterium]|nr:flagellar filament capping protein FliD [Gammaproteobacteria bacterium]
MADVTTTDNIGSKITQALSMGSGVDIYDLATTLADAETTPQINALTAKQKASTVSVSGFGVLKASVSALQTSFDSLQDKNGLLVKTIFSQNTNRVEASLVSQEAAEAGTHQVLVNQLARAEQSVLQRYTGSGSDKEDFSSLTQQLNGGSTINFSIVVDGTTTALNNTVDTPQGIIDAVNATTGATGVKARTINITGSGSTFRIVLEGKTGADNAFTFSGHQTADTNNQLFLTQTKAAQNLDVKLNNLDNIIRDNNSPSDLIEGVQLNFKTASSSTTNIMISENTSALETKVNALIDSYNDVITMSDYLTGKKNEEDELAGSLSSEKNTVNMMLTKIRSLVSRTSSTTSNGFENLRHIGVGIQLDGKLKLNQTTYATAVKTNFSDIRTMLTADTNDQSATDTRNKGLALDSIIALDTIVSETGSLKAKETSGLAQVERYEEELTKMQEKLESIKARYLRQFSAMESIVQKSKNTGEYLTNQFKAMQNSNN